MMDQKSSRFRAIVSGQLGEGFNKLTRAETSTAQRWLGNPVNMVIVMVTTVHWGTTMYFVRAGSDFL